MIGGALVIIVALVLGLGVFTSDDETAAPAPAPTSEASDPTGEASDKARPSRQPAPDSVPTSDKSVSAPLPDQAGGYSKAESAAETMTSYTKGSDRAMVLPSSGITSEASFKSYVDGIGMTGGTREGEFLCGDATGQVFCVVLMSDGVLNVVGTEKSSTAAFANELLAAI